MNRKATLLLIISVSTFVASGQTTIGREKLNGTRLFVSTMGKGETIVLLHGGPGLNHGYFLPYLNALEKKFRLVYYDQRASGLSAVPSADSVSMQFFIEDLEALRQHLKIDKLNVIAHSWGAVLLAHYATKYPGNIKKAMLVSPAMLSREYDQEAAALAKQKTTAQDSIERATLMAKGKHLQIPDYEQLLKLSFKASAYERKNIENLSLNLPANFAEANRALFTGLMKDPMSSVNMYDSLHKLKFPVLIVHGAADIIPMSAIERLRKNLPLGSLMIFERSGHFPFVEENKRFIQLTMDYFKKR